MCFLPQFILTISCGLMRLSSVIHMHLVQRLAHDCCFMSSCTGLWENEGSDCVSRSCVQDRSSHFHSGACHEEQQDHFLSALRSKICNKFSPGFLLAQNVCASQWRAICRSLKRLLGSDWAVLSSFSPPFPSLQDPQTPLDRSPL